MISVIFNMKAKKSSFLEWNGRVLTASLKRIDLNIFLIVFLDALFYAASGLLIYSWFGRVWDKIASSQAPPDVISLGQQRAQELLSEVRLLYIGLVVSFVILLLAIIFLASILKGIIWAKTTKTKITLALISKFLVLNLVWMGFWFVFVLVLSKLFDPSVSAAVIGSSIIISIYLSNTLYSLFMKDQKLNMIWKSIKISIVKIRMFILPYMVIGCVFFIIMFLSNLIKLDQMLLMLSIQLFSLFGGGVLSIYSQDPLVARLAFTIIALISIMINPFLVLLFGVVRYYHSELVFALEKEKPKSL